jgi:hypothetical protein
MRLNVIQYKETVQASLFPQHLFLLVKKLCFCCHDKQIEVMMIFVVIACHFRELYASDATSDTASGSQMGLFFVKLMSKLRV